MSRPHLLAHPGVCDLPRLLLDVTTARDHLNHERAASPRRPPEVLAARADFLAALERYASALKDTGRPLPYRLRDELHLHRSLKGAPGMA